MANQHIETRGSSMFTEISYDDAKQILVVDMVNFGRYSYRQIPVALWNRFRNASSYGHFYNTYIKGVYQYTKLR